MSPPLATVQLRLPDESFTARLGALIARALIAERARVDANGFVLGLSGDLGAGKTALVRACLRELGVAGPVRSPTFTLLEPYVVSSLNFYHFDFYRFGNPDEFADSGFRELFGPGTVCAVEWPERAGGALPTPDLDVTLNVADEGRIATLLARSEGGVACLQHVRTGWADQAAHGASSAGG